MPDIIGSKIGGTFRNLTFDSQSGILNYKSDGSSIEVSGGGGSNVKMVQLVRPITDEAIFPVLEVSQTDSFSTISYAFDATTTAGRAKFMAYLTDVGWGALPSDGLGTPYDNEIVLCDLSSIENLTEPYYIRWKWVDAVDNTVETSWKSTQFPSSPAFVPNVPSVDASVSVVSSIPSDISSYEDGHIFIVVES